MHRRRFTKNLLLAGLGVPTFVAATTCGAFAGHDDDDGRPQPYDQVTLRLPQGRAVVRRFLVPTESGLYGIDLGLAVPQMAAERIDLGAVPLLGQILTPPLKRQFRDAQPVGWLYLVDHALVLLPGADWSPRRMRVQITHRKVVYRPVASLRMLEKQDAQIRDHALATRPVGMTVAQGNSLLAIVPPTPLGHLWPEPPALT